MLTTLLVAGSVALACAESEAARGPAGPGQALPPVLARLEAELQRFRFCADEALPSGADWWGFWWSLPEKGCGDCEDFAAFSYARLRQAGVPAAAIRLMAAEAGEEALADGKPARVLHLWLEVELAGDLWTVSNRQIRSGSWRERELLSAAEVEALVEERFGPNWPYGIDAE